MRLTIHHETLYEYPRPVANSVNEAWLRPMTDERQSCLSFRLTTLPSSDPRPYTDYFGNTVYHFDVHEPHSILRIVADAEVLTEPFDVLAALAADASPYEPLVHADDRWLDFLAPTPLTAPNEQIQNFSREQLSQDATIADVVRGLAEAIHARIRYEPGRTAVTTTAAEALAESAGVCQDYTHLFLATSRLFGIPARYVSGYLYDEDASGLVQVSHAWPEVLLPATGWVGLDITNGCPVDERYVRVAIGRDYTDIPPVRGAYAGAAGSGPTVAVSVQAGQQ